jgi:ABC-type multidrug transport system permease subunit
LWHFAIYQPFTVLAPIFDGNLALAIFYFTIRSLDLDFESSPSSNGIACDTPSCANSLFVMIICSAFQFCGYYISSSFLAYGRKLKLSFSGYLEVQISVWRWVYVLVDCV